MAAGFSGVGMVRSGGLSTARSPARAEPRPSSVLCKIDFSGRWAAFPSGGAGRSAAARAVAERVERLRHLRLLVNFRCFP